MVTAGVLVDLVDAVNAAADGATVALALPAPADVDLARRWCDQRGHQFLGTDGTTVRIRRGRAADPLAALPPDRRPGYRLWLYTNFDCNLACDYCCASSSPRAPRRALGVDVVERLAAEAPGCGVHELYLTGGEPFLLPEIDRIVNACVSALPTTVLTNGMLFRGRRRAVLDALPRTDLALQISVDSATPTLHDRHRGEGSHARALDGVRTAIQLGFRVRIAATLDADQRHEEDALHRLCDDLGVPLADRVIRRVAHQGEADHGVVVTRAALVPEVCVTAAGLYWHPVAVTDPAMLVTRRLFPLADAVHAVISEFSEYRRHGSDLAVTFPCA